MACMAYTHSAAQDQVVTMTTGKAAGETMTIVVNNAAGITVDWGDGQPVAYQPTGGALMEITSQVKGSTITLSAGNGLTTLIVEGQGVTQLNASKAKNLRSLYCQDNGMEKLTITGLDKLTDLDCSGNSIASMSMSASAYPAMERINIAGNGLKRFGSSTTFSLPLTSIKSIDISGNAFPNGSFSSNKNMQYLNISGNAFTSLNVNASQKLQTVLAHGNKLKSVTLPSSIGLAELRAFVADSNAIAKLDLSKSGKLEHLSVSGNGMETLTLPKRKLTTLSIGGNSLTLAGLPTANYLPEEGMFSYLPMNDIDISSAMKKDADGSPYMEVLDAWANRRKAEYSIDMSEYRKDANGRYTIDLEWVAVAEDGTETVLTEATSQGKMATADYTRYLHTYAFIKPMAKVYGRLSKETDYPGIVFKTTAFAIRNTATGIEDIKAAGGKGAIYDLQGRKVESPSHGGIYIVNGKKVVIK